MNRRQAIAQLGAASVGASSLLQAQGAAKQQYYDLRTYYLRTGISKRTMPSKPAGGTVGVFNAVFGENTPFVVTLQIFNSFAETENVPTPDFDYIRYDRTVLRAFQGMPELKTPAPLDGGHIFEMRTYESANATTLKAKIDMFQSGEIGIFRRLGMNPVFFGEALTGDKLPHLTYMLAYDDLAARDRVWRAFGADPEWGKLRTDPRFTDPGLVANITNVILRPAAISDIR